VRNELAPHCTYLRTRGNHPAWRWYRLQVEDLLVLLCCFRDHHLLLRVPVLYLGADVLRDAVFVLLSLVLRELVVIDLLLGLFSLVEERLTHRLESTSQLTLTTARSTNRSFSSFRILP